MISVSLLLFWVVISDAISLASMPTLGAILVSTDVNTVLASLGERLRRRLSPGLRDRERFLDRFELFLSSWLLERDRDFDRLLSLDLDLSLFLSSLDLDLDRDFFSFLELDDLCFLLLLDDDFELLCSGEARGEGEDTILFSILSKCLRKDV